MTIYDELAAERRAQVEKWGDQQHPDGTSLDFMAAADEAKRRFDEAKRQDRPVTWQMILDEEVLEAYSETDHVRLREELIQVAAVCIAWIEDLDRPPVKSVSAPAINWSAYAEAVSGNWADYAGTPYAWAPQGPR